jgi:transposase
MPKVIRLALTPDQRDELDRRLRARTTERRASERRRIVRAVAGGATVPQAAAVLGGHEQTVRTFGARFRAAGFAGLADRPRPGRPSRVTDDDLATIWRRSRPASTRTRRTARAPGRCPTWPPGWPRRGGWSSRPATWARG